MMASKSWYRRFISKNDTQTKDLLILRIYGSLELCRRCFKLNTIKSDLDCKLTMFVCFDCRQDQQEWDYRMRNGENAYSIVSMSNTLPFSSDL